MMQNWYQQQVQQQQMMQQWLNQRNSTRQHSGSDPRAVWPASS
jgi:hypothetical protein